MGVHLDAKCPCGESFIKFLDLKQHVVSCQMSLRVCIYCGQTFTDSKALRRHECTKRDEERNLCPLCRKRFKSLHDLKVHLNVDQGQKSYECPHCSTQYRELSELEDHVHVHVESEVKGGKKRKGKGKEPKIGFHQGPLSKGVKQVNKSQESCKSKCVCPHCSEGISSRNGQHKCSAFKDDGQSGKSSLMSWPDVKLIPQTNKQTKDDGTCDVEKRINRQEKRKCPYCLLKFTPHGLRVHLARHRKKKLLECPCGSDFMDLSGIEKHIINCDESQMSCVCFYCGQSFTDKKALQEHACMKSDEKPNLCPVCRKGFNDLGNLKAHLTVHKRKNPHNCPHCNTSFSQLLQLEDHIYVHIEGGVKAPKVCQDIGPNEAFTSIELNQRNDLSTSSTQQMETSSTLLKSVMDHTVSTASSTLRNKHSYCQCEPSLDEPTVSQNFTNVCPEKKAYFCVYCQKVFRQGSRLKRHLKIHMRDTVHSRCYFCVRGFMKGNDLVRHLTSHR